jgi:nucleoside-diphosphate-sugar epimerase
MKALVTGGGGFLGRRIVELLRARGDEVTFLARGKYPEVEATGAKGLQIDLKDKDALKPAVAGQDVVFHVAAKAGYWGSRDDYFRTNVDGTRFLLDAMEEAGAKKLVYTSTPSVLGYDHDVENGGQDLPYAEKHESYYSESKAAAERLVLEANSRHVATVSLRPHLVFGPRDLLLLPRVVQRAKAGVLPIIGDGRNKVDMTYIDNAAWAHLDAAGALVGNGAACAGKAYFISNDDPVVLWDWLSELLAGLDIPPPRRRVSLGMARALAGVLEAAYTVLPLSGEPRMTRFLASGLARHHWYDMGPAKRDLGYTIRVGMADGTAATVADLRARGVGGPSGS